MDLSPDQEQARAAILAAVSSGQREIVLSGPAGSGKTTLMRQVLADLRELRRETALLAPTGKAAARLRDTTGAETSTIHRALYKTVRESETGAVEFADPQSVAGRRGVIVCDEASMVGKRLASDLIGSLPTGAQILWVGDREQLPPVQDTWGADFASPTALLTQVHRQAEQSPIIRLATAVRQGQDWRRIPPSPGYSRMRCSREQAAAWLVGQRMFGADATLVTFSNATRRVVNALVRDQSGRSGLLDAGDHIVCTRNQYARNIWNGEVFAVVDCWPEPVQTWNDDWTGTIDLICAQTTGGEFLLWPESLDGSADTAAWRAMDDQLYKSDRNRLVRCEYGECLTVHKSQGSQWDVVGLLHDKALDAMQDRDPETYRRLVYTAVTRAARELVIFEV